MIQRTPYRSARLHPTRHLLYAFVVGALLTCSGFILARLDSSATSARRPLTTLVVAGSETLRPLMSQCAETHTASNSNVEVVVRGGGSAAGIASLLAGQIDLALSSRELTSDELNATTTSGELLAIPIAREGIALIAHRGVAVRALDLEQLAAVLAGEIGDWSALAAGRSKVVVVGRAAGSGTAAVIQERVLGRRAMSENARLRETHEEVIAEVGATPGAIGYTDAHLARAHAASVQIIPMRHDPDGDAFLPDSDAIVSGKYPIARTLYLVVLEPRTDPLKALIEHCTGHPLIRAAGFLPMPHGDG